MRRSKGQPPAVPGAGTFPNPEGLKRGPTKFSLRETQEHLDFIESIAATYSVAAVVNACRRRFGFSGSRARRLLGLVHERWRTEDEKQGAQADARAAAIRRVKAMLQIARGQLKPQTAAEVQAGVAPEWVRAPNHTAVARYEVILMRLQGTDAPIKIDVDVRVSEAVVHVVGNLTPEQVQRMMARRRELERQAEVGRALAAPAAE